MAIGSPQWMYKSGEAYELEQSLKFNEADLTYLSRTASATSAGRKKFSISFWIKSDYFTSGSSAFFRSQDFQITLESSRKVSLSLPSSVTPRYATLIRDSSAWYHMLFVIDTTQGTAADRVKFYLNGDLVLSENSSTPGQNSNVLSTSGLQYIGSNFTPGGAIMKGYLAEYHFLDTIAATPADFGETGTYGEWKPKAYSGTYGTNGFYLPFKQDYTAEGFSTTLYKGTGNTNINYVGGIGFSPSLVWIKNREANNNGHHFWWDKLRGAGTRGALRSNLSNAQGMPNPFYDRLSKFDKDGFSIARGQYNAAYINSAQPYVAWSWDMGADTPTGFGCVEYYGSGYDNTDIGGLGDTFTPDLVWIKKRDASEYHVMFDTVRGLGDGKAIYPNATVMEGKYKYGNVSKVGNGQFTLATGTSGIGYVNEFDKNYVAWCWDMGGTSVANTTGDINTTVRANPTYGQSIVAWDGTGSGSSPTVGHGLSSAPELIIVKRRSSDNGAWPVLHAFDTTKYLQFQDVDGATSGATVFDNTAPTSSVFTVNATNAVVNASGHTYVAYCFHSVSNYSKIGSFSGTGSSGNTITTGFRPALLIVKQTNAAGENWYMFDSSREPLGELSTAVKGDVPDAEVTNSAKKVEFTDTGFKLNSTNSALNASGSTYIYYAVAGGMDSISDYNTDGSIDSRVKASTTYGQSIVSYNGNGTSGATVGHGLSSTPEVVLVKSRNNGWSWEMYHSGVDASYPQNYTLELDGSGARVDNTGYWNDTAPTSSVFSLGNNTSVNKSDGSGTYIAYCWHSVAGYSSIGSWVGNANDTAPVVTTGFAPAWVMYKKATGAADWVVVDNVRNPTGIKNLVLHPNTDVNPSETTSADAGQSLIFLANGFQPGGAGADMNGNGETYIYMAFADKREYAYWLDQSGNNNDWTSNNLTESDISVDSPTNNFATWNPLFRYTTAVNDTYSEGNLKVEDNAGHTVAVGTIPMTSGKWYWEVYCIRTSFGGSDEYGMFAPELNIPSSTGSTPADVGTGGYFYFGSGGTMANGSYVANPGSQATVGAGDILAFAYDVSAATLKIYVNNFLQKTLTVVAEASYFPNVANSHPSYSVDYIGNFGQDSSFAGNKTAQGKQDSNEIGDFFYTPPTGFLALCTKNLPDATVVPSEHFNTVLYTGDGGSNRALTNFGFQPDFVWIKTRNQANDPNAFDSVRGATKVLRPSTTSAEFTDTTSVKSFDSDGITVGNAGDYNASGNTYVAWNWKAGTSVSGNSSGSGTAQSYTGSVNTDAGFSIIKYTGNGTDGMQVPHHLGVVPDAIIIKSLTTQSWNVFFPNALGADKGLQLDNTGAQGGPFFSTHLSDDMPTTSVVKLGNGAATNTFADGVGQDYIMYCWANKDGYCKVGSYTGNGNADGTFVYTGHRPSFVMIKPHTASGEWVMFDNKRDIDNVTHNAVRANNSAAESDVINDNEIDMLSNGFKARGNGGWTNTNGRGFIYITFAETPFKYSNAR